MNIEKTSVESPVVPKLNIEKLRKRAPPLTRTREKEPDHFERPSLPLRRIPTST